MYNMKIKYCFLSLSLFLILNINAQHNLEVNLNITDTVIVVKNSAKKHNYAAKVNMEINIPKFQDTVFLFFFNKYVRTNPFFGDIADFEHYRNYSHGLQYIIEDKNQHIMESNEIIFVSYKNPEDEIKNSDSRYFVNSKLQIEQKLLNDIEQRDYDLAVYEVNKDKQEFVLYPLIGNSHFYLPKGEYFIYFVYSYNKGIKYNRKKVFNGSIISNKVKLIVK